MLLGGKRCVSFYNSQQTPDSATSTISASSLSSQASYFSIILPQDERRNKYIAFCCHSPCLQALFLYLLETLLSCLTSPGARQAGTGERETEQEGKEPVTCTGWANHRMLCTTTWPQPEVLPEGEYPVQTLGICQAEEGGNQTFLLPPEGPRCPPSQGQHGYLYLATHSPFLSSTSKPVC